VRLTTQAMRMMVVVLCCAAQLSRVSCACRHVWPGRVNNIIGDNTANQDTQKDQHAQQVHSVVGILCLRHTHCYRSAVHPGCQVNLAAVASNATSILPMLRQTRPDAACTRVQDPTAVRRHAARTTTPPLHHMPDTLRCGCQGQHCPSWRQTPYAMLEARTSCPTHVKSEHADQAMQIKRQQDTCHPVHAGQTTRAEITTASNNMVCVLNVAAGLVCAATRLV
jgi:hypothetical protein